MEDYFRSNIFSYIMAWLCSIPLIIALIAMVIQTLFEKTKGVPRIYMIWIFICILIFSPLRYVFLQIFVAIAYPVQSFRALFTCLILLLYIPIVFGILYAIGFGLPAVALIAIAGSKEIISKVRLWISALAAPIIFLIGSLLFYLVLPYAAYSTHWLNAKDVIRATNGPSQYYFTYVVEQLTPLQFPAYAHEMGLENLSSKERLRSHVACVYLGAKQFSHFMSKSYPEEYERRINEIE